MVVLLFVDGEGSDVEPNPVNPLKTFGTGNPAGGAVFSATRGGLGSGTEVDGF